MQALDAAHEYRFVMPIAQFGAAVMPMLTFTGYKRMSPSFPPFTGNAPSGCFLPEFLASHAAALRTAFARRNAGAPAPVRQPQQPEIADILGVKVATVKTHVIHILQKLGVKRRGDIKEIAQKLHIIEV